MKPLYHWSEMKSLSEQLASPQDSHKVTSQRILVNDGEWEIRSFRVADFPKAPVYLHEMDDLIGSVFDNNTRIGCPFVLSFMIYICEQSRFKYISQYRGQRARQRAKAVGKDSPKAGDEAFEALNILKQIEDGEKVVVGDFQILLYSQQGEGDIHETALMNVFQAPSKKWRLIKNNLLHLVPLVALMADPNQQCSPLEISFIEQAVKAVWENKAQNGSLNDIAEWLLRHEDTRAKDIGLTLYSYTEQGQYGGYFNGQSNVNFDNKMVVFELEVINSNKRLQSIIFMLLMYHVTEKMYLGGRKVQMALIIDEAWDMLKERLLRSVSTEHSKYAEMMIQGGGGEYAVVRLILDPYSRILYSTQGDEFAAVEALCQQGVPIAQTIAQVTKQVYG